MGTAMEPLLVALMSQLGRRCAVGSCPGNLGDTRAPGAPSSTSGPCPRNAYPWPLALRRHHAEKAPWTPDQQPGCVT